MRRATVVSDASHCRQQRVGGWAVWIRVDGVQAPIKGYGVLKGTIPDSTVAEMYAVLNGIWLATRYNATHILVRTDCMAVVDLIDGRCKKKRLIEIWQRCKKQAGFGAIQELTAKHVKGHGAVVDAATFCNGWVDKKARFAMREARDGRNCYEVGL